MNLYLLDVKENLLREKDLGEQWGDCYSLPTVVTFQVSHCSTGHFQSRQSAVWRTEHGQILNTKGHDKNCLCCDFSDVKGEVSLKCLQEC